MYSSTNLPVLIITITALTVLANYGHTSAKCATLVEQAMLSAFNILFPQSLEDG
jgi:hypothetical protein